MMIEMNVTSLTLDPATKMPFIIMKDRDSRYSLPIWIGIFEASAIAMELEGIKPERPMTHDLLGNILCEVGAAVEKVEITHLQESTFFAKIHIKRGKKRMIVDSRPSDSIALALRMKAPIFISEDVIMNARSIDLSKCDDSITDKDKWSEVLENMSPEAFGKYKM